MFFFPFCPMHTKCTYYAWYRCRENINWFSDVAGCMKLRCIQWRQRTNSPAPGCTYVLQYMHFETFWQKCLIWIELKKLIKSKQRPKWPKVDRPTVRQQLALIWKRKSLKHILENKFSLETVLQYQFALRPSEQKNSIEKPEQKIQLKNHMKVIWFCIDQAVRKILQRFN